MVLGDPLFTGHMILRMRVNFVAFTMGKRYFSPITWHNLRRSTVKVTKSIGKFGSEIPKMWIIFAPGDRSRDTAHAQ